jgi:hypothetical protein
MNNLELEILQEQGWRFVDIPPGVSSKTGKYGPLKGPRVKDWQDRPLLQQRVPDTHNIGVLTGEHSGGILAVDFDGSWTWDAWVQQVGIPIPDTVTWTSGRPNRAQMAFSVHPDLWHLLPNRHWLNGPMDEDGKPQQLEFRWSNLQSVLPPSIHEEIGTEYTWVQAPSSVPVALAPPELIELLFKHKQQEEARVVTVPDIYITPTKTTAQVRQMLADIKTANPTLPYAEWTSTTWAAIKELGGAEGIAVMQEFWPEQRRGEYAKLLHDYKAGRAGGLASKSRQARVSYHQHKREVYTSTYLTEMEQLERKLKELKND